MENKPTKIHTSEEEFFESALETARKIDAGEKLVPDQAKVWKKLKKKYLTTDEKIALIAEYNKHNVDQAIKDAMIQLIKDHPTK